VASLNGTTNGGWVGYAVDLAEAGASAIELNVYLVAADPEETAVDVEDRLLELVSAVRAAVQVPVAVKLSPYFSALGSLASRLVRVGADGLVLFNRWAQPDLDLDDLAVVPALELSTPADLRVPLRWVGILRGRVGCSLALSGGVHGPDGVVKGLLVGADVVMSTSGLLRHGPEHAAVLRAGLVQWLEDHDYESVTQLRGAMSQRSVPDPDAFERAGYLSTLQQAMRRYASAPVARW
jgi:dihydroorotate dehydrogenase (fumarate)